MTLRDFSFGLALAAIVAGVSAAVGLEPGFAVAAGGIGLAGIAATA